MSEDIYDLCIVGAGIFGCAAARYASANPSLKICLIGLEEPKEDEDEERDIFSSHYDSGRIVKVLSESPAYQVLARNTINSLIQVEKLSGKRFYSPVGFMNVGKKGNRNMKNIEAAAAAVGTKLIHLSNRETVKKIYPFLKLRDDEYGLLEHTGSGIVNPRILLKAEKEVAEKQGCHILIDQVMEIHDLNENHHTIDTIRHGKINAKRVLITTGAFTNGNEFHAVPQLEIYVYRDQATKIRIPDSEAERLSSMPGMVYKRDEKDIGFYILPPVQYPDGRYYLKIGSMMCDSGKGLQTLKEIKDFLQCGENPQETKAISEILFEALPGLKSDGLFRKICVTAETPSGFPYVDQVSPTVTIAVAGCGWGVTCGEEIGRLAANLSLTGSWDSEVPKTLFEIIPKEAI